MKISWFSACCIVVQQCCRQALRGCWEAGRWDQLISWRQICIGGVSVRASIVCNFEHYPWSCFWGNMCVCTKDNWRRICNDDIIVKEKFLWRDCDGFAFGAKRGWKKQTSNLHWQPCWRSETGEISALSLFHIFSVNVELDWFLRGQIADKENNNLNIV